MRFASFVDRLTADDGLTIVGDLCDFWLASRQRHRDPDGCEGLRSLAAFRDRGGRPVVLLGNHDGGLAACYRAWFGATILPEPQVVESHGLRLHLVHGHRVGARKAWKAAMEREAFLHAFGALPGPVADAFRAGLDRQNLRDLEATHGRHLDRFRRLVAERSEHADLFLFGHVHERFDEQVGDRRLIVVGDWFRHSPFIRVDGRGVHVGGTADPVG